MKDNDSLPAGIPGHCLAKAEGASASSVLRCIAEIQRETDIPISFRNALYIAILDTTEPSGSEVLNVKQ